MTTDRLLELARRAGVATTLPQPGIFPQWEAYMGRSIEGDSTPRSRPRLDIAVDLQATLEGDIGLHWVEGHKWRAWWDFGYEDNGEITDTIERCIVALAERAMK